jgi:hypothetical protein
MQLAHALIWIWLICVVMAFVVSDRFDLHDHSKEWPRSHWATVTPKNRSAFVLFWGLTIIGVGALVLSIVIST